MKNMTTAIAIAAFASAASAGIVDMKFTGTGAGSNVQIQLGEANAFNVFAGELNHVISNATGLDTYLNGEHRTFCADITEHVSSQGTQYQTAPLESIPLTINNPNPMSAVQASAIRSLYSQNASVLLTGGISNAFAAAMQLTVWEIVTDFDGNANSINFTEGSLRVAGSNGNSMNQDILNQVDSFRTQVMLGLNQEGPDQVLGLTNGGAQDQLLTIPAPGAFALISTGGLMITRRRRS